MGIKKAAEKGIKIKKKTPGKTIRGAGGQIYKGVTYDILEADPLKRATANHKFTIIIKAPARQIKIALDHRPKQDEVRALYNQKIGVKK